DTIAKNARTLCAADSASVLIYDGQLIHLAAHDNPSPERARALQAAYPMPATRGQATGRAIMTGRPAHIPDVSDDADYTRLPLLSTFITGGGRQGIRTV